MKRSSNSSESRECRRASRTKHIAQGGGAEGVHPKLCRMRKGVAWVQFNEVWYIGTFLSRDVSGFHFVLRELGKEWSACIGLGESERISRANQQQQSPSLAPLAVRQYKSCGRVDRCAVSCRVASEWAEKRPPWDHVQQSRCIQRLGSPGRNRNRNSMIILMQIKQNHGEYISQGEFSVTEYLLT